MVLWFISYATFPIILIVDDISIVIVHDISNSKAFTKKHGSRGNKTDKPLSEMHLGINLTKFKIDRLGSWNEKTIKSEQT